MIRDGIDPQPLEQCAKPCGACGKTCRRSVIDQAIRDDGWLPIGDLPKFASRINESERVTPNMIQALTRDGRTIKAVYVAKGDYVDLWMDTRRTVVLDVTHYKPTAN